jgi:type IV pilus assembly protein PilY1
MKGKRMKRTIRLLPAGIAFAATLAAAPGHAVTIPNLPLQTGTAYPPANVMFILDDSGSMNFVAMPADVKDDEDPANYGVQDGLNDNPTDRSYLNNTIYYDPRTTYLPWPTGNGATRMTGGTSVDSVYTSWNQANGDDIDCGWNCEIDGTRDLRGSVESVFYVPRDGVTASTSSADFLRYRINSSGHVVVQGSATRTRVPGFPKGPLSSSMDPYSERSFTIAVPSGATKIEASTSGGGKNVELNLVKPNGSTACSSSNGNNGESCSSTNPTAGNWTVQVFRDNGNTFSNVTLDAYVTASSETQQLPNADRTEAEELTNIATWYSYYRTRIKTAKAGASEAFSQLGSSIRVGYDSIWNRNALKIPVGTDDGLFRGTNRSTWFGSLQGAGASGGTPLHGALQRTGEYFEDSGAAADGPWSGPGTTRAEQLTCRQNFAILTTDGYWNDFSGYDSDAGIDDSDSEDGASITSEDGLSSLKYVAKPPYRDDFVGTRHGRTTLYSQGDTLADIANYYWKRDLVTSLANDVPSSGDDPAFWQHMSTFGVSIGLRGTLDPKSDLQSLTNGSKHWPDPYVNTGAGRIDDLWHASVNGHGNFVTASNPKEFVEGLIDALATVARRPGSASNVTANSTSFQTDTRVYQASYVSGKWIGELAAFEVSSAGVTSRDADGDGLPDAAWKASEHIPAFGSRRIFTSATPGTGPGTTFPTSAQRTALDQTGRADVNGGSTSGQENADYIAGSSAKEARSGGMLRDRDTVLGDIANSSPMYVQDNEMIYVGANDGMLHAFSATDRTGSSHAVGGQEMFAYVPAGIDFAALGTLSDPQYSAAHHYFVDGPVVVTPQARSGGKNYLVATLGRGGKGLFGLDVTDPESFGASDVKWDLTGDALGADMGMVLGEPLIATLNGTHANQAVIVGNGINSSNGHAVLFVLDIVTGAVIAKLDTGVGGDNGLSAPRGADTDGNGTVDYVYAGDRKGNVWKFDLSSGTAGAWNIAGGKAMFTATDADGNPQPITAGLALARNPATSDIWVFVGTGSFMESSDVTDISVQSIYGLIDHGFGQEDDDADSVPIERGDLVERHIVAVGTSTREQPIRGFEASAGLPTGVSGWYVDLDYPTEAGERVVSNPRVQGTVLLAASLVPPESGTCDAGGSGFINALDAFTGTSLGSPYFDVNGDGKYDELDSIATGDGTSVPVGSIDLGVGMPTLPTLIEKLLVVGGSKGTLGSVSMNPQGGAAKRISWREILRD